MSPTERSLALLRAEGWLPAIVEHYNRFARVRQDLYGILDILAVKDDQTLGIQTTSASNVAARQKKILEADATQALLTAGWRLQVHGWRPGRPATALVRELTPEGWITLNSTTVHRSRDPAPGAAPAPGPGSGGPLG